MANTKKSDPATEPSVHLAIQTKYTLEIENAIVYAITLGASMEQAAQGVGINKTTLYNWMHRFPEFKARIETAQSLRIANWLQFIENAAMDDWRAAAWKLERIYPEQYGRVRLEVTGKDGAALEVNVTKGKLSEKLSRFIAARRATVVEES